MEGPLLSLKSINAIAHFTDWIIAHVHIGGIGWNGFMTFGMIYWLVPRLYGTKLYSVKLANVHFWLGTLGIILYAVPLYFAGFFQSLMWKQFTPDGFLVYPNFLDTLLEIKTAYWSARAGWHDLHHRCCCHGLQRAEDRCRRQADRQRGCRSAAVGKVMEAKESGHWHRWIERRPVQMLVLSLIVVGASVVYWRSYPPSW